MKNMGLADRAIRLILAAAVLVLLVTDRLQGTAAVVPGVLAALFFVTGLVGTCPAYLPFRITTRR